MSLLRRARAVREPFDFLRDTDPGYLINFLRSEHPQTVALILAHLNARMTADLLARLPTDLRAEVARRMATMDRTSPDVVQELEELLRSKLSTVIEQGTSNVGGVDYVVQVLNQVDRLEKFKRRHRAQAPENQVTSRWRYSLMNWGHDPLKE